jgi:hypothetical protein
LVATVAIACPTSSSSVRLSTGNRPATRKLQVGRLLVLHCGKFDYRILAGTGEPENVLRLRDGRPRERLGIRGTNALRIPQRTRPRIQVARVGQAVIADRKPGSSRCRSNSDVSTSAREIITAPEPRRCRIGLPIAHRQT